MIWLAYFMTTFMVLRLMVSLSNLLTRQWPKPSAIQPLLSPPLISVLIPARNEEKTVGFLLDDLLRQNYENINILVYNDLSEDNTAKVIKEYANNHQNIKLINGTTLPSGWTGKNYACHRLSLNAEGEYLLFLDADVRVKPSFIHNIMVHTKKYRLDLLSLFPRQEMHSFGEKITVPVMNWVLVGLLPLILTRISGWPCFSAANGQCMLFRSEVYNRNKFHMELRNNMVEDIGIFRIMKKMGFRTHTALSNGDISCRMYGSWMEAIEGFSKNVIAFFGGHSILAILFALITTTGFIPVVIYLPRVYSLAFFIILGFNKIIISIVSRQPVIPNLLLSPMHQFSFCTMIFKAITHKAQHRMIWKGRNLYDMKHSY